MEEDALLRCHPFPSPPPPRLYTVPHTRTRQTDATLSGTNGKRIALQMELGSSRPAAEQRVRDTSRSYRAKVLPLVLAMLLRCSISALVFSRRSCGNSAFRRFPRAWPTTAVNFLDMRNFVHLLALFFGPKTSLPKSASTVCLKERGKSRLSRAFSAFSFACLT